MKPEKLKICGWGPYRELAEIDFDMFGGQGLFLITGATGAGKTTIFDAVTYALYGSLSGEIRDKERNSVRSDFAEADTPTYVELQMTHGGKRYYIKRNPEYLRPKKRSGGSTAYTREKENAILRIETGKDSEEIVVVEGVKEVNAHLKDVMALDYAQFKQLSMIAQGEFARLLTAPAKDKTRIFREIFGTGIYEKFTAGLSQRAKKQYMLIMEQKHRLEEVMRLFGSGMEQSEFEEEKKQIYVELTGGENPNYEGIEKFLKEREAEARAKREEAGALLMRLEGGLGEKQQELARKQEENKRIREYLDAVSVREMLESRQVRMIEKESLYRRAVNAGWVEASDVNLKNLQRQLAAGNEEEIKLRKEIADMEVEAEQLQPVWENQTGLREFIEIRKKEEEGKDFLGELEKDISGKEKQEKEKQESFLAEEKKRVECRNAYESAVTEKRLAVVGLAAEMLKEGEPCPVCGSVEHPKPAVKQGGILSEEELEQLKALWDAKEEAANRCYKDVLVLQTQINELRERMAAGKERIEELEELLKTYLAKQNRDLYMNYFCQKAEDAYRKLQKNLEKAQRLQVILQEKRKRLSALKEIQNDLGIHLEDARKEWEQSLEQYGFTSREDYENAHLEKKMRDELENEITEYRKKVSANKELLEHLKNVISGEEVMDLQPLERELTVLKEGKDAALRKVKSWERFLQEAGRTYEELHGKRAHLERMNKEYGRIKELENIASGNNSKRLVFEQYVLAGYFEEILAAANIRFRKMTSGRYEMQRGQEVGDGRTKDNLEIQVMDYYTGKQRSVRTLSGGESFKASLALALGLSDVIQAMNGGIRVETLFIDEGFGALDSESLDQACETLLSLVESDRLIGIISHVPELRERINKQIVIYKQGSGSTLSVIC